MKMLVIIFVMMFSLKTRAENIILSGARALDLYQNLSVPEDYGTKSFVTFDNLIKIECSTILYQPVCDVTMVNTADQKTWDEFKTVLNGPNVSTVNGVKLETSRLVIECQSSCSVKIIFE